MPTLYEYFSYTLTLVSEFCTYLGFIIFMLSIVSGLYFVYYKVISPLLPPKPPSHTEDDEKKMMRKAVGLTTMRDHCD